MQRVTAAVRSHPWLCNVAGYTALFAAADLIQQSMLGEGLRAELRDEAELQGRQAGPPVDLWQTARVALIGFCFHANFNYRWLGALERALPGGGAGRVAVKVAVDQIVAAPVTIGVFYTGLSVLEGKDDPFEDLRQKFWTSYTAGLLYWSSVQAVNFSLVPPAVRTVFVGGAALLWTVFLCHLRGRRELMQDRHTD
ncbi:MP17L protein, partial [Atractosteus spatula]|nr:MP17L protein [Atractosteus spatula]